MKKFFKISSIAIIAFFGACTSELPVEIDENETVNTNVCRMTFEAGKPNFDGTTRADGNEWKNGDCIYLMFIKEDDTKVAGKAVYDANDKYWNLEYSGELPNIEDAKCRAYYFEDGVSEDEKYVHFSAITGIYTATGKYTKSASGVNVSATLSPYQSRIRFTGTAGKSFTISGPHVYAHFKKESATFYYDTTVESSIKSDGSSPYLYMTLYGTDYVMSVSYDNLSFSMTCESPVLDDGVSGYMKLPTKESHSGWTMIETTAPKVGETSVTNIDANTADFSASIVSDGNAAITECGFVYSLTKTPTLENMTLKCSTSSFKATASDLKKNTTYYVRAYATNAAGTTYGAETSFTTKAKLAVSNGLYAYFPFDGDIENHTESDFSTLGAEYSYVNSYDGTQALQIDAKNTAFLQINDPLVDKVNMTISFWVKDLGDGHVFHAVNNSNINVFDLSLVNGMLKYVIRKYSLSYSGYYNDALSFTNGSLSGWHMITISHNIQDGQYGTPATKKLYIDGKLADTITEQYIYTVIAASQCEEFHKCMKFVIGGSGSQTTQTKIIIDNLRVYNSRVLSADEVKEIYNSEKQ